MAKITIESIGLTKKELNKIQMHMYSAVLGVDAAHDIVYGSDNFTRNLSKKIEKNKKDINDLNTYMASCEFTKLSRKEKDLLYEEQRALSKYLQILGKRCDLYDMGIE